MFGHFPYINANINWTDLISIKKTCWVKVLVSQESRHPYKKPKRPDVDVDPPIIPTTSRHLWLQKEVIPASVSK